MIQFIQIPEKDNHINVETAMTIPEGLTIDDMVNHFRCFLKAIGFDSGQVDDIFDPCSNCECKGPEVENEDKDWNPDEDLLEWPGPDDLVYCDKNLAEDDNTPSDVEPPHPGSSIGGTV